MTTPTAAPDLGSVLTQSAAFYKEQGLRTLAAALPSAASFSVNAASRLATVSSDLATVALIFPPLRDQLALLPDMIARLAATPSEHLADGEQYTAPFVQDPDTLASIEAHRRPEGAYLLLLGDGVFPAETRGKTAPQLARLFDDRGWSSLTAPEYLVLQRLLAERHGDHRFDLYTADAERSGWMWLLDSCPAGGVCMAYWNPGKRRVELGWCKRGSKNERKGAYPTVVLPL